eukprot:78221-Chlamydomonas_euryale.AAC.2
MSDSCPSDTLTSAKPSAPLRNTSPFSTRPAPHLAGERTSASGSDGCPSDTLTTACSCSFDRSTRAHPTSVPPSMPSPRASTRRAQCRHATSVACSAAAAAPPAPPAPPPGMNAWRGETAAATQSYCRVNVTSVACTHAPATAVCAPRSSA